MTVLEKLRAIEANATNPESFVHRNLPTLLALEVVSVRVERLQAISEADARAEGIYSRVITVPPPIHVETRYISPGVRMTNHIGERDTEAPAHRTAKIAFECLWESINGYGSWFDNPWVWVVEFKKVEAP